jgi:hypothetical protein
MSDDTTTYSGVGGQPFGRAVTGFSRAIAPVAALAPSIARAAPIARPVPIAALAPSIARGALATGLYGAPVRGFGTGLVAPARSKKVKLPKQANIERWIANADALRDPHAPARTIFVTQGNSGLTKGEPEGKSEPYFGLNLVRKAHFIQELSLADFLRDLEFRNNCFKSLTKADQEEVSKKKLHCDHVDEGQELALAIKQLYEKTGQRKSILELTLIIGYHNLKDNGAFTTSKINNAKKAERSLEGLLPKEVLNKYLERRLQKANNLTEQFVVLFPAIYRQFLRDPETIIKNLEKENYNYNYYENLRKKLFPNLIYNFKKEQFTFTRPNGVKIKFKKEGKIPKDIENEIFTVPTNILKNIQALQMEYVKVIEDNNKKLNPTKGGGGPEGNNTTTTEDIYYPDITDMEIPEFTMEHIQNATILYDLLYKKEVEPSASYEPSYRLLPRLLSEISNETETEEKPISKLEGGKSKKYRKTRKHRSKKHKSYSRKK